MGAIQSITAAVTRLITRKSGKESAPTSNGLSSLAWELWETVPEVGAYADWIGNAMSGAVLFAGKRSPDGTIDKAPDGSLAAELVSGIAGGPDGQSVLLGDVGVQLAVTGEFWNVIIPAPTTGLLAEGDRIPDDRWLILSTAETRQQRGKITALVDGADLDIPEYDPDDPDDTIPIAFRVHRSSNKLHHQATSPVIRSITVLEELRLLNAAVAAIAKSRITGRGILLVPAGARFPTTPGQDPAEDSLLETFIEVASTAIREPDSAAATVPIVLEIPGDLIGGVKWLQFTSEFDSQALELRNEAIRRFATGADVPADVLLGLGDTNHWGAWAMTAEALRLGVEPKLALYCQALTEGWLQPMLEAEGVPDADEWVVWYDTSGLRSSSNKGANALEAYDKGIISAEAARRELGFTEDDAPAAGSTPTPRGNGGTLPVDSTQTPPALAASDTFTLDSLTAGSDAALAAAVDGIVWGALVLADRKLMLTPVVPRSQRLAARELRTGTVYTRYPLPAVEDVERWHLLEGALVRVPEVANRYGVDPLRLVESVHTYVTALLTSGEPHDFENVPRMLAQLRVAELGEAAA